MIPLKKIIIYILSILTAFCVYSEHILKEMVLTFGEVKNFDMQDLTKFSYTNIDFLLVLGISIVLILFYKKYKDIKKKKAYNILSLIFALLLTYGFSYSVVGDSSLVAGNLVLILLSVIKIIVYYNLLSTIINVIAIKIKDIDLTKIKESKKLKRFKNYYELHPYKTTIIVILIAWLPYIISFYPMILSPDPSNQIKQYFGMETHYINGVKLIDENIVITNHHPVFHTFIMGGFAKIGDSLGNINFGLFLFSCFQIFVLISALTYSLIYLKKLKIPFIYRFIVLVMYSIIPVFPLYALSPVKDVLFGAMLIFFIIEMHKLITSNYSKKEYFILSLLMLFMMLVRNNGVYILLLTSIGLIIILKEKRVALIVTILCTLFMYEAHNKILLPALHITPGSIREVFSVPFQQTARLVKYHSDDLSTSEIETIDKVLGYETLGDRYKPNIVDPVKNEFNKETTNEELIEYFKVWFMGLFKHPVTYINATVNTVYGYFYPNTSNWYVYHNYDKRLTNAGLDYHYIKVLSIPRAILSGFGLAYPYIPLLGASVNIGFNVWIYMFLLTFLIVEHKKKFILLLMPAFILLLTCVVGPVNTYFRYMVPIVFSLPLIIGLIGKETKKNI